jgi:hypothetical protein
MPNSKLVEVALPNLKPTVLLPLGLAKTLEHIIALGPQGVASIELIEAGLISAKNNVVRLRKLGARIHTSRTFAEDQHGNRHPSVAYYSYEGWG